MKTVKVRRNMFLFVTLMVSFAFWIVSIIQIPLFDYSPDPYWYVRNLPIYYWIGLTLLVIVVFWYLSTNRTNNVKIDLPVVLLFVLYLFGTIDFVTVNPYFMDIYARISEINVVSQLGTITTPVAMTHADTPGSIIFFAILKLVVGNDLFEAFVKFYDIFILTILSVFVYIIARRLPISRKALMAPIAFLSLAVFMEFHIDRQSFALALFSVLLFSTFCLLKSSRIQWSVMFTVAFTTLAFSHPGTPLIFLGGLVFAILVTNLPWFRSQMATHRKNLMYLIFAGLAIYLTWSIYFSAAYPWFVANTLFIWSSLTHLLGGRINLSPETIQSPSQLMGSVLILREMQYVLLVSVGLFSTIYLFSKKSWNKTLLLAGLIGFDLLLEVLLFAGHANVERGFLHMLFPVSILCALAFETSTKKRSILLGLLSAILILSMILLPITSYGGNLPIETPSSSEVSAANFASQYLPNGTYLTGFYHGGLFSERIFLGSLRVEAWSGQSISQLPANCSLLITNEDYNYYSLRFGSTKDYVHLEDEALTSFDRVCDSGLARIYISTNSSKGP